MTNGPMEPTADLRTLASLLRQTFVALTLAVGVYGHGGGQASPHGYSANAYEAREAMGIDWMRHYDVVQAIPPAYTEDIGHQLLAHLAAVAA